MPNRVTTEIEIDQPVDVVWQHLMDFNAYEQWNPFIRKVTGKVSVGAQLEVSIAIGEDKLQQFRPKVVELRRSRDFLGLGAFWYLGCSTDSTALN